MLKWPWCVSLLVTVAVVVLAQDDEMVVEDEHEQLLPVFTPTSDWQIVEPGQAIPAGLHIRIDLQTGLREAKLMDGSKLTGDQRRVGHYGYSDRRGVVNKRSKVFTKDEYMTMLREESTVTSSHPPALTHLTHDTHTPALTHDTHTHNTVKSTHQMLTFEPSVTLHGEVVNMLELVRCLGEEWRQPSELVRVLDELEFLVHEIDNGRDLVRVGGLPTLLRLLNHTHSDVRSQAALVLGSAAQSNPLVQDSLVLLGGVDSLCALLVSGSEVVVRRGLFAVGALMRGRYQHLIRECREFHVLREAFSLLSDRVKLKVTTLVGDLAPALGTEWCEQVSSLVYSDSDIVVEGGLRAMTTLHCDATQHLSVLRDLTNRFTERSDLLQAIQLLLSPKQKNEL